MNVVAIIQARTGSTRLPNKIFSKLNGYDLLYHVVNRLKPSKEINNIVIATTNSHKDDIVEKWCIKNFIDFYRGSEKNVLKRYYNTGKKFNADIIIRITADDPFKDFRIIDEAIKILKENDYDFVCNNSPVSYPEGLDVEVLTMEALAQSFYNSKSSFEQEHVTQYIHRNKTNFKIFNIKNNKDYSHYRWTIDTKEDYLFVREIYENLFDEKSIFTTEDIYEFLEENLHLLNINDKVKKSDLYK